ncbi:hypothetical protein D2E25_1887 [Bifidobacterium goeldii]|uniref:Tubuliform spidroin n=1 Tax=Bifidobacterium goeldii TaxID=2306975 RepID=A0A430FDY3_9BIFI|nr:hypothetical protein [Bifidobacterium goeldii]RSX51039.1 hypothetical protein D2E25_1887 [Bifidobacterium goeldii]
MSRYANIVVRGCACLACAALTLAPTASGITTIVEHAADAGSATYTKTQSVFTVADAEGEPGRLYVDDDFNITQQGSIVDYGVIDGASGASVARYATDGNTTVNAHTRVTAGQRALPWNVRVVYGLNGPETDAAAIAGASGLVDIRITLEPNPVASGDYAQRSIPVIAFTVPDTVTDDITVGSGMTVTQNGSDLLVTGIGMPGKQTVLDCYMNATKFTMGHLAFTAVQATDMASLSAETNAVASSADNVVDTLVVTDSTADKTLIDQLTAMRDREAEAAQREIAEKTAAHQAAFDSYMVHYVGSYTTHLSGSIGSSTQMQALIGTAGELTGNTPMAQAVVDLANAVNAVSAAHEHTGAVRAIDDVIRRIQQRGTSGLINELTTTMGEEAAAGTKGYKAGQSQLSNAMIPYSMAYTDTYTKHLSQLTGGTSAGAAAYEQQAIDATNAEFKTSDDLKSDTQKVDAAMSALAAASEHTGAANALQQISVQFADQLSAGESDNTGSNTDDNASSGDNASNTDNVVSLRYGLFGGASHTMAGRFETKRLKRVNEAKRKEAQRKAEALANGTTDDSSSQMDLSQVMGNASGLGMLGNAAKGGANDNSNAKGKESNSNDNANKSAQNAASAATAALANQVSAVYGIAGMDAQPALQPDTSVLVDEAVEIGSVSDVLTQAATALANSATADSALSQQLNTAFAAVTNANNTAGDTADTSYDVLSDLNRYTTRLRMLIVYPAIEQ